jgi:hypothetical protein
MVFSKTEFVSEERREGNIITNKAVMIKANSTS